MSSVKRGRDIGTRRFRVRGQRTPEVNKVALTALKYFIALIAATLIASINTLILTALIYIYIYIYIFIYIFRQNIPPLIFFQQHSSKHNSPNVHHASFQQQSSRFRNDTLCVDTVFCTAFSNSGLWYNHTLPMLNFVK